MALPDKHQDEPTVEVDANVYKLWVEAEHNAKQWKRIADGYRATLEQDIGDRFAATVDGVKVVTYRPSEGYAGARIQKDYPDLTAHFVRHEMVSKFDVDLFARVHPEIAEQYRIRSFRQVES